MDFVSASEVPKAKGDLHLAESSDGTIGTVYQLSLVVDRASWTLFALIVQIILLKLKRSYYTQFLYGVSIAWWIVPAMYFLSDISYFIVWLLYSVVMFYVYVQLLNSPPTAERLLPLKYISTIYGIAEQMILLSFPIFIFGPPLLEDYRKVGRKFGLILLYGGFYYGLLSRCVAELFTDKMALIIPQDVAEEEKEEEEEEVDNQNCLLCNTRNLPQDDTYLDFSDRTLTLPCRHIFHKICFDVWCLTGRKRKCPRCEQQVDPQMTIGIRRGVSEAFLNITEQLGTFIPVIGVMFLFLCNTETFGWMCPAAQDALNVTLYD